MASFPAHDVDVVLAALDAAKAAAADQEVWWRSAVKIDWASYKAAGQGSCWVNISFSLDGGKTFSQINIKFKNIVQNGMMVAKDPLTKQPLFVDTNGVSKPQLGFTRYAGRVATAPDEVSPLIGADGQQVVPGPEVPLFRFLAIVNKIFRSEVETMVEAGSELVRIVANGKKNNKTVETVVAEFAEWLSAEKKITQRAPRDIILTSDQIKKIKEQYPPAAIEQILPLGSFIQASNIGTAGPIQDTISAKAKKNAGCTMANPIARLGYVMPNAEAKVMKNGTTILDLTKVYKTAAGKVDCKRASVLVDGVEVPVTPQNLDQFSQSGSTHTGSFGISICFSNLSISLLTRLITDAVKPGVRQEDAMASLFSAEELAAMGDMAGDISSVGGAQPAEAAASATFVGATQAGATAAAVDTSAALDALVDSMGAM